MWSLFECIMFDLKFMIANLFETFTKSYLNHKLLDNIAYPDYKNE